MMRCSPLRAHAPQLLALSSRRAALSSSATQPDVVVLGASVMDLMAYVPTMPSPGATVLGTGFEMDFGGKGANQAVMAGKLGCNVAMITKINGGDAFGREMVGNFEDNGVSAAHVLNTDKAATGAAAIVIDDSGQNQIAVVMGANNELTEADMEASRAAIAGAQMLVCQLEVPLPVTMAAMRIARDEGTTVFLNTAPACELPAEAFKLADIICPNETEATMLTGLPVETVDEAKAAGAKLLQMGVKNVILTLGERGALLVNGETDGTLVEASSVKAVNTVGAGDSFVGAFSHFHTRGGLSMLECMQRACTVATLSVQKVGTQASYPALGDLPADCR